ncbi:hypothetical protein HK101_004640, partial [Irineochytrium annulatum]
MPVPPPKAAETKDLVEKVAQAVAKNPVEFQFSLMQKESSKPDTKLRFLWPNADHNAYFAYKVWGYRNP